MSHKRKSSFPPKVKVKVLTPGSFNLSTMNIQSDSDTIPDTMDQLVLSSTTSNTTSNASINIPSTSGGVISSEHTPSSPDKSSVNEKGLEQESSSSGARAPYMTKTRKQLEKKKHVQEKNEKYNLAFKALKDRKFSTIRACSEYFKIPKTTLHRLIKSGYLNFQGSGHHTTVLSPEEEKAVIDHVNWRQEVGCGISFYQLGLLLQEIFLALKSANSSRVTGFEGTNQLPGRSWVRRFVERHSICLRRSAEISKGRQILTSRDLDLWQNETENYLLANPVLAECFKDPRRLFNQDESSIELGSSSQRILAKKGTKVIYNVSSGSREHITVSFACNAAGGMVPPRVIYKGVRNIASSQLNLPEDGLSGKWNVSVAPKGYITRPLFLEVLKDINNYVVENNIPRPVVLIMDGASPHLSLEAAEFCIANQIQPWLLRPNMTHLTQPLDLVFFAVLKKELKKSAWNWQTDPKNTGQFLNKYSVIGVLYEDVEACLKKLGLIQKGFKRAGLYPWDKTAPDRTKLLPGTVFAACEESLPLDPAASTTEQSLSSTNRDNQDSSVMSNYAVDEDNNLKEVMEKETECDNHNEDIILTGDPFNDAFIVPEDTQEQSEIQSIQPSTSRSNEKATFLCNSCNKRILERFKAVHVEHCPKAPSIAEDVLDMPLLNDENIPPSLPFSTVPSLTLAERAVMLNKFEVLLLTSEQVSEFLSHYEMRNFVTTEPLFSSWLTLKLASIPSEREALDKILQSHKASNIPKSKNKRKQKVPSGPARFDPSSQEWISILEESKQDNSSKTKAGSDISTKVKPKKKSPSTIIKEKQQKIKKTIRN